MWWAWPAVLLLVAVPGFLLVRAFRPAGTGDPVSGAVLGAALSVALAVVVGVLAARIEGPAWDWWAGIAAVTVLLVGTAGLRLGGTVP